MSAIKDWFRSRAANNAASPDGSPEGMARSGVNDAVREIMASIKLFFDSPGMREIFEDYTIGRVNGGVFLLFDGSVESDASGLLEDGQRIRMTGQGGDAGKIWEGFVDVSVASIVYDSGPGSTTFGVAWIDADSEDTTGPTEAPSKVEVGLKELGQAAWYDTGVVNGTIPRVDDLDPHVFLAEADLSVDKIDGQSREQIAMSSARGRLNMNGDMGVWQRGVVFVSSLGLGNDDGDVCADGYTIISDGDDRVIVSRDSDAPVGFEYSMRLQSVSTQKYGVILLVEAPDASDVAGAAVNQKISASFQAKFDSGSTGIDTIRAYLLNLKNVSPGHPVSVWPAGAGSDFTPTAAGWEIIASVSVTLTDAWQTFSPVEFENIDPDLTGAGNGSLAIAFHVDEASISAGSAWFLDAVQINRGEKTLPFIRMPRAWELSRALRYCETTFVEGTTIADNSGNLHALQVACSVDTGAITWQFAVPKYRVPTLVTFNPGVASPTNDWYDGSEEIAVVASVNNNAAQLSFTTATNDGAIYRIAAYLHANIWGNT